MGLESLRGEDKTAKDIYMISGKGRIEKVFTWKIS